MTWAKKQQQINQIIGWSLEDFSLNLQILIFSFPFNTLGRWVKIDSHQVPASHFAHFIFKLQVQVNSIRETSHKAQPLYSSRTRRVSYKIFNPERLYLSLQEQDLVELKTEALFAGNTQLEGAGSSSQSSMTAEEKIAKAKSLAYRKQGGHRPSFKSLLLVGLGNGRATREVEIIWWPELYSTSHGQMTSRIFIEKCEF